MFNLLIFQAMIIKFNGFIQSYNQQLTKKLRIKLLNKYQVNYLYVNHVNYLYNIIGELF